jgi:hypothetical protein
MSASDEEVLFQMIARWRSAVGPNPDSGLEIVKTKTPPDREKGGDLGSHRVRGVERGSAEAMHGRARSSCSC